MNILKIMNDHNTSKERKELNSYGGCGYYRTVKVAEQLSPEHNVTVWNREWEDIYKEVGDNDIFFRDMFKKYDVVWLHFTDNPVSFSWLRVAADKYGKKIVMDIDDNYLDVDNDNPAKKLQNSDKIDTTNKVAMLSTILSFCDAITVSTVPLKERIAEYMKSAYGMEKKIFVVPNYNDIKDWDFEPQKSNKIIIGYIGGLSHVGDFDLVKPALKKILETYPDVWLQVMGQMNMRDAKNVLKDWGQDILKRVFLLNATKTQPEYPKYLAEQGWTIGIAPLVDTPFNKCKSHIKWMEYSMYKIPVVASRVYPYYKDVLGKDTIIDNETGLLANNDEWFAKLSKLIEDEKLREKLGNNAFNYIKENWQYNQGKKHILEIVERFNML